MRGSWVGRGGRPDPQNAQLIQVPRVRRGFTASAPTCMSREARIPRLRERAEGRTVAGLRLHAEETGAEALVFVRDRDGERGREEEVEAALEGPGLPTAGACAVERLEHWLLAVGGRKKAHKLSAKQVGEWLQAAGMTEKRTDEYVIWLSGRSLDQIPQDAKSLLTWLDRVRALIEP